MRTGVEGCRKALTRLLARELSSRQIRVNATCAGWVRTDMGAAAPASSSSASTRDLKVSLLLPASPVGAAWPNSRAAGLQIAPGCAIVCACGVSARTMRRGLRRRRRARPWVRRSGWPRRSR
ncbi:MAG: SDR family oxidoreductase [Deltaproteobacteria bacterium]|nr:MAG: SDR family oxidoreductase [Deltaproteobacteria bacterium]TMQ25601.1 MAG: SDR family oxidoreductase [Deltaproteobacteria bacterium]